MTKRSQSIVAPPLVALLCDMLKLTGISSFHNGLETIFLVVARFASGRPVLADAQLPLAEIFGKQKNVMKTTHSPDPRSWFYLLLLASLLLVTACEGITNNPNPGVTPTTAVSSPTTVIGNSSPTLTGSTPTATPSSTPKPAPSPTPTPAPNTTVTITTNSSGAFMFSPSTLTVAVGATVVWKNQTQVSHTVITNTFGGGFISPGATLSIKFTSVGTFAYHCSIHPYMTGTIIVK